MIKSTSLPVDSRAPMLGYSRMQEARDWHGFSHGRSGASNTFWTSAGLSFQMVDKLTGIPNVVGLKWACPRTDAMEFET